MTKWYNYGVALKDESVRDDVIAALEDCGLSVYSDRGSGVKATGNARDIDTDSVKSALRPLFDDITGFIFVSANDTSDTASATVYEVQDGSLEQVRSDYSGGESTRRNWFGVSYGGVSVDGGKYY